MGSLPNIAHLFEGEPALIMREREFVKPNYCKYLSIFLAWKSLTNTSKYN